MPTGDYSKTKAFKEYQKKRMLKVWKDPNSIFNTKEYREKLSISHSGKNHYMYGKHHSKKEKEKNCLTKHNGALNK